MVNKEFDYRETMVICGGIIAVTLGMLAALLFGSPPVYGQALAPIGSVRASYICQASSA